MQNEYQLRLKDLNYSEKIKEATEKFNQELDGDKKNYELLLQAKNDMEMEYEEKIKQLEERQQQHILATESQYQQKIMTEVDRYQQLVAEKKLRVGRVDGKENPSDLGTKYVTEAVLKHLIEALGLVWMAENVAVANAAELSLPSDQDVQSAVAFYILSRDADNKESLLDGIEALREGVADVTARVRKAAEAAVERVTAAADSGPPAPPPASPARRPPPREPPPPHRLPRRSESRPRR